MWLEAIILKEDLSALVGEFLPVSIRLGQDGELSVSQPTEVALVDGVGLRVTCEAKLRWSVLGLDVPVTVRSVSVLLRPEVEDRPDGSTLVFKLCLEHADFAGIPTIVDEGVTDLINRELDKRHVELAWGFASTLSHVFALPAVLRPLETLSLATCGAQVKATSNALGFAVKMSANVHRGTEAGARLRVAEAPAARVVPPSPPPHRDAAPAWSRLALGGLLASSIFVAAYALGRAH